MRRYEASAGDLSSLSLKRFAYRFREFKPIHERHMKLVMNTSISSLALPGRK